MRKHGIRSMTVSFLRHHFLKDSITHQGGSCQEKIPNTRRNITADIAKTNAADDPVFRQAGTSNRPVCLQGLPGHKAAGSTFYLTSKLAHLHLLHLLTLSHCWQMAGHISQRQQVRESQNLKSVSPICRMSLSLLRPSRLSDWAMTCNSLAKPCFALTYC